MADYDFAAADGGDDEEEEEDDDDEMDSGNEGESDEEDEVDEVERGDAYGRDEADDLPSRNARADDARGPFVASHILADATSGDVLRVRAAVTAVVVANAFPKARSWREAEKFLYIVSIDAARGVARRVHVEDDDNVIEEARARARARERAFGRETPPHVPPTAPGILLLPGRAAPAERRVGRDALRALWRCAG